MCGLVGVWHEGRSRADRAALTAAMVGALAHRGPDGNGSWADDASGVALGHARLAILDLSARGAQPMHSASGRYAIVYNGEVYNHLELRPELEAAGARFDGTSDTETILAAFEAWGLERSTERFVGMFAIALWDRHERRLTLIRDRLGIKPLYVGVHDGALVFGSDLAMLRAFSARPELDRDALAAYFRYACVPGDLCIFKGFRKVSPGSFLHFAQPRLDAAREHRFWRPCPAADAPRDERDAIDRADAALRDAVRLRMLSDVPLGAFLSGGIDSSVVVALMQEASTTPVRTFSLGYSEGDYDERSHAREIAQRLGTAHTELEVSPGEALAVVPELSRIFTEPFADSSQIPTLLVSRLARRDVTVVLTGDGGDEVFGGYNRHVWGPRVWAGARLLGMSSRQTLGRAFIALGRTQTLGTLDRWAARQVRLPREKLDKLGRTIAAPDAPEFHRALASCWADPTALVLGAQEPTLPRSLWTSDLTTAFRQWDLEGYLNHDILVKVDRATMAVGLEGRVPLIDHRVVELGLAIPSRWHVKGGIGKRILRSVLERRLPSELFQRPKAGFGVPLDHWLRGPLRDWAEDAIAPARLRRLGLSEQVVASTWTRFLSGEALHHRLWAVVMACDWADRWGIGS